MEKIIEGFHEYSVSEEGKIFSYKFNKKKELKQGTTPIGYRYVNLSRNKRYKSILVHRLVALHFIENKENKKEVNHINENKRDNRIENLEWCTRKENCNHGTRNERISEKNRTFYDRNGVHRKNKIKKEHYKTFPVFRGDFKKTCNNRNWTFEEFEEIYAFSKYYKINKDGTAVREKKKFFYISKK